MTCTDNFTDASQILILPHNLLMKKATEFAKAEGASRIDLLTAFDNRSAQHLYEKLGYKRDLEDFYAYSLKI